VAAPVHCNAAITILREKQLLAVPSVGVQRPTVRERYGWPLAPVLVVNLYTVLSCYRAYILAPYLKSSVKGLNNRAVGYLEVRPALPVIH
jgi:hypothetical protein